MTSSMFLPPCSSTPLLLPPESLSSLARTTISAPQASSVVSQTHQLCNCQSINVKPDSFNLITAHLTFSVSPGQDQVLSLQLAMGPCGLAPVSSPLTTPVSLCLGLDSLEIRNYLQSFSNLLCHLCLWSSAFCFINSCPSPKTHFCYILFQETGPCLIAS